MKKNLGITLLVLLVIGIGIFGYIVYEKNKLENDIVDHLVTEKNILEEDILSSEAFIANLPGSKNYMVSIKIENDTNTYFYYKNENEEIILESYTDENGEEHIID